MRAAAINLRRRLNLGLTHTATGWSIAEAEGRPSSFLYLGNELSDLADGRGPPQERPFRTSVSAREPAQCVGVRSLNRIWSSSRCD
jgi:hypothetical protein